MGEKYNREQRLAIIAAIKLIKEEPEYSGRDAIFLAFEYENRS